MAHTVVVTSSVALKPPQIQAITQALSLKPEDQVSYQVDPGVIAGLRISVDGKTVDLTVIRQLQEIEK